MAGQCVIQIDPDSMTEVARWIGDPGQVLSLNGRDGLFAGLNTPDVVNINTGSMEETNRWTGAAGEVPQTLARAIGG